MPTLMTADTLPPPARGLRPIRRDATVKVIYLGATSPRSKPIEKSTRHVRDDVTAEMVLPEATRGLVRAAAEVSPLATPARVASDAKPAQARGKNTQVPKGVSLQNPEGGIDMDPAAATTPDAMIHGNKPGDDFSPGKTIGWVVVLFALVIVALAILARLPTLE